MKEHSKTGSSRLSSIWLTVLLLCILVLASAALLGSFIKRYAAQEKNVIAVMADSNAMRQEYPDGELPAGANPNLKPSWETSTSVDLFKNTYTDASGNVTVQSANGENIIAPGTSNAYEFNLKNTGNISLDYTLKLDGVFKISDHRLPFYVRLSHGNEWVVGGENEWAYAEDIKTLVEKNTLPVGESSTYVFEWQWPYESDDESQQLIDDLTDTLLAADKNDTEIGIIASTVKTDFHLDITVVSAITPDAIAVMGDGVGVVSELVFVGTMAGLMLTSGIWLILILFRRKLYFTGITVPPFDGEVKLGKKTDQTLMGRFVFKKARFGKRTLQVGAASLVMQFKSCKVNEGIRFEQTNDKTLVLVGRHIRAVELFVVQVGENLTLNTAKWAAIDKKHAVYTPLGITPAVDKRNATPDGLCVDKNSRLFIQNAEDFMNETRKETQD